MAPDFMARHGARLVDQGWPVIPIWPGTKKPGRFHRGEWRDQPGWTRHCDRPTTLNEVEIWEKWPDCAVGIACGFVVGIDIDVLDAELAHRLEALAREMLGDTPLLRIGKAPKRLLVYRTEVPFSGPKRAPLEILAHGRQFVAFALHPDTGRPYDWPEESPLSVSLDQLPAVTGEGVGAWLEAAHALLPPDMKPAVLPAATGQGTPAHALAGTREAIREALVFIPNADLDYDSWVRIGMALKGALGEDGADLFAAWSAQSAKHVPDTTAKAWGSFRPTAIGAGTLYHHAIAAGWKPDPALVLDGTAPRDPVHPAAGLLARVQAPAEPGPAPHQVVAPLPDLSGLDGALGLFVSYILDTAIRPQPWLAVGAALAALGTLIGRRYRTASNLRANLYVVGMAASGGGKDHARNAIKEAFLAAGLAEHLGGNRIVSGAGLLAALHRQPASLFQIDEFGQFLATVVDKRRAPKHLAEVWDLFTELSTSAGNTFFGAEYADQKQRPRQDIIQPCCCLHATTVPETFWTALRNGSLQDGSLARFLIFRSPDDIPDRNLVPRPLSEVPPALVAALKAVAAGVPGATKGNLVASGAPTVRPAPLPVPMDAPAERLFADLDAEITLRQRQALGSGHGAVLARVWENTTKVALIRAVGGDPARPVIRLADAEWARALVAHCVDTLLTEAERHVADNEIERNHKRVLEIVRQAGRKGITKKHLYDRTRFLTRRDREEILATLAESERIVQEVRKTGTKPLVLFRVVEP
jgi:hypothetical protein